MIAGPLLASLLLCTSRPDRPPVYHSLLAVAGFALAIVWIYVIANEVVSLLKVRCIFHSAGTDLYFDSCSSSTASFSVCPTPSSG